MNEPYSSPKRVLEGSFELRAHARNLRRDSTSAEAIFWQAVRRTQIDGLKFRRQHVVGTFILDFYCPALRLIVEIDGAVHEQPNIAVRDALREDWLRNAGFRIIRFRNDEVLHDLPRVCARLRSVCASAKGG